jgi:hypothetical protein
VLINLIVELVHIEVNRTVNKLDFRRISMQLYRSTSPNLS